MYRIDDYGVIKQWGHHEHWVVPLAISMRCHNQECGTLALFQVDRFHRDPFRPRNIQASAKCPICLADATIFMIEVKAEKLKNYEKPDSIYIDPSPTHLRKQIEGINQVDRRIAVAYQQALTLFSDQHWAATVNSCRKALEGIVKNQIPEADRGSRLYDNIQKLRNHVDFGKTMTDLVHVLREGGNLGSHFYDDDADEPDQQVASMMLELLEYIMEYFYILPNNIQALSVRASK